jgi:hypothetical protein
MNPTIRVVSTEQPNDDVELLRLKAELQYGAPYSKLEFYGHTNHLYTVGYVDDVPRWVAIMQQREEWVDAGVVGIVRRVYTDYIPKTGIDTHTLGLFGEPTVIQQVEHARKIGAAKLFVSNVRRSFVRSSISKLSRMFEVTSEPWYCDDQLYKVLPYGDAGCHQYCMWNYQPECFFEKAT